MDINEVIKRIQNMNNLNPQELQDLQANNPMYNAMNGANLGMQQGAFGNVTNNEMSMFSGNPMNGAVAGMMAGGGAREADMFRGQSKQEIAQIRQSQENLATLKQIGQKRILTDDEKYQAIQEQEYLQSISSPVEVMPPDIDDLNLPPEELRKLLEIIESQDFRGFPISGGR